MRGLLTAGGPMTGLLAAPRKMDAKGQEPRLFGQATATGAKPPARDRVSPWRVFDRVLGGQTISEGLDAERARLEAMAAQPGQQARMETLRAAAQAMGPQAMIAFETNPEAFGAQLAEQYAPQVIAEGGIQSVIGSGASVENPRQIEFGDAIVEAGRDGVRTLATRQPTFAEQTGRISATSPVSVAPGGILVDPVTGSRVAAGAPRVFSASDGEELYTEDGSRLASNERDVTPSADMTEAQIQLDGLSNEVFPTLDQMESLLQSGDLITGVGAEQRLAAARLAASAGNAEARRRVAATEEYRALAGRLRVGMAKSLGANPSDADLQLLNLVAGGDISQSVDGLLATTRQGRELAERQRQTYSRRAQPRQPSARQQPRSSAPIAEDANGNRVQWNGSAWVPL